MEKPQKCVYPNCQECTYADCRYDFLEPEDYTETNNRDYELFECETGKKYHKGTDIEYKKRRNAAYQRNRRKTEERKLYYKNYYQKNREKILKRTRENYDKETNAIKCKEYRQKNLKKRKEYEKQYYELHKEEKIRKARERYYRKKLETQSA